VALAHDLGVGPRREPLRGVGAHGLEHQQPGRLVRTSAAYQEALRDQPVEGVQVGAGDSLRRLDRGAAGEDPEAREARLLVVVEQVVAPVDRRAQRPLARGRVAWACAERGVEPLGDLGR